MTGIFKAYDIRGKYPSEIDEKLAYKIGRAYATLMQSENKNKKLKIAVGRDMRISSPQLSEAMTKGLLDQGADVVDIGLVSTPTFYFGVANYEYDGGMQVSASHNPKEYNGIKMVRKSAIPISDETGIKEIEQLAIKNKFSEPKKKGKLTKKENVMIAQVKHDLTYADVKKIKPFKVVCDPANAMGITFLTELFKHLPCKLVKINFELDGTFPSHQADPLQEENMQQLHRKVIETKADLGVSTDGDADRIFFVDNNGETIPQPIVRGMMAQVFLKEHPGAKICYDIRPGKITRDMIIEAGGIPILTRVGHSLIKEKMRQEKAVFAGESSGHFFVKTKSGYYEVPMIILLKMLTIMSEQNKPIAEIIKPYKKYFSSGEINSEVEDKTAKMKELAAIYKDAKEISYLDGVTIEFDDFWFNVRPSNTEPLLRLNLEARSKEVMEKKKDEVLKIIRA